MSTFSEAFNQWRKQKSWQCTRCKCVIHDINDVNCITVVFKDMSMMMLNLCAPCYDIMTNTINIMLRKPGDA